MSSSPALHLGDSQSMLRAHTAICARDARPNIRTVGAIESVPVIQDLAKKLREGQDPIGLDPLIVVARREDDQHIVLEGCKRLTALLLTPEMLPSELRMFVGYSPDMDKWHWYLDQSA